MILMLCGYSKAGKYYIANKIKEKYPEVVLYSFSTHLKEIVACANGITTQELEEQKEEFLQRLIDVSENILKKYDNEYFVNIFVKHYLCNNLHEKNVIITDCMHDIELFRISKDESFIDCVELSKAVSIFIDREKVNKNCDCEIDPLDCDYIYDNNKEFNIDFFEKILELS